METEKVKTELEKLARRAAIYFIVAVIMFIAALAINNFPTGLIIGSVGVLFIVLTLQKIIEFDRLPCRHSP